MSFVSQIEEVFGVDIWELKPQYKIAQQNQTINDVRQQEEVITEHQNHLQLIYSNEVTSSKIINILTSAKMNLTFLKNIANSIFFNSKVSIYKSNNISSFEELEGINLNEKDLLSNNNDLLSIQNKKYILSKLYEYADFSSR
ncbi:chloroquine resistance protein [Francisella hispaniensis]|uniref:Chloroquine resistance protein n=1 Tax=Francisella hispaniensis FSC454 TaxID=1088883 RepID=A0AAC9J723_9GAMM|nr:chloroquine resistance protein [Francisella hispaniensis]APD50542.1 chloroquine resistance protein [Francisella hispaniensis FSC454]KYW84945.1 chloroquine resistance protein [Francisella hispaniensis FSC454]MBK2356782.1 chloroquine resistance protein [Francisella hispaniensis]